MRHEFAIPGPRLPEPPCPIENAGHDRLFPMTTAKAPVIAFVIPCYNEQAGIQHTLTYLLADMAKLEKSEIISSKSYVVLVDDGSTDQTWPLVERITQARPKRVRALKLSRNVGHQNALLAGLLSQIGKADATISLDADLQDD